MPNNTKIEWTDQTWNPITGCTKVSAGCKNCYAERVADRFWGERKFIDIRFHEDRLTQPLRWKRPRRVFVNSMSDLFHEKVPDEWIDRIFAVMALTPQHTYQILTKRAERMRRYMDDRLARTSLGRAHEIIIQANDRMLAGEGVWPGWPLPNVWLGVSVEDQATADERIPLLRATHAAIRFCSYEPALGPVDFKRYVLPQSIRGLWADPPLDLPEHHKLDWIIVGGESGPGARPFDIAWARSVRDQCGAAGVAFFMKQLGSRPCRQDYPGELSAAPTRIVRPKYGSRKGNDPSEWPEDLRVREWPEERGAGSDA